MFLLSFLRRKPPAPTPLAPLDDLPPIPSLKRVYEGRVPKPAPVRLPDPPAPKTTTKFGNFVRAFVLIAGIGANVVLLISRGGNQRLAGLVILFSSLLMVAAWRLVQPPKSFEVPTTVPRKRRR